MSYVDGFVCAVPTANREKYRKHAEAAAPVFKEHGALRLVECWGDDVPDGKLTSFPRAVKCKPDEQWSSPFTSGARCGYEEGHGRKDGIRPLELESVDFAAPRSTNKERDGFSESIRKPARNPKPLMEI